MDNIANMNNQLFQVHIADPVISKNIIILKERELIHTRNVTDTFSNSPNNFK